MQTSFVFLPHFSLAPQSVNQSKIDTKPKDKRYARRLNYGKVSIRVCKHCEFLHIQEGSRVYHIQPTAYCSKHIQEAKRHRLKPQKFSRDRNIRRKSAYSGWTYRKI